MSLVIKSNSQKNNQPHDAFNLDDITDVGEKPVFPPITIGLTPATTEPPSQEQHTSQSNLDRQVAFLKKVISETTEQLHCAQQKWLVEANQNVLQLAVGIAERIVRSQLDRRPEISLQWIRESLELFSSSPQLMISLSPQDEMALGEQTRQLAAQIASIANVTIAADPSLAPGECRVETKQGLIDQTVKAQLQRITEELEA